MEGFTHQCQLSTSRCTALARVAGWAQAACGPIVAEDTCKQHPGSGFLPWPATCVRACAAGWWYSILGGCGGYQEPQLVFLDHGRYIVLPEAMRQLYCQLWCSFIANDTHTAREVATGIAGEPSSRSCKRQDF